MISAAHTPGTGCGCDLCRTPRPVVFPVTQAEAMTRNRAYEAARRRYRTENPHKPRSDEPCLTS